MFSAPVFSKTRGNFQNPAFIILSVLMMINFATLLDVLYLLHPEICRVPVLVYVFVTIGLLILSQPG